jgi:hypothetical protein
MSQEGKNNISKKDVKSTFELVNFTPGKDALNLANTDGFKVIGGAITAGMKKIIIEERTVIVEAALAMIKKHEQAIGKIKPAQEALLNAARVQIQDACFTNTQIKQLEEMERKRNKIVETLNLVMKQANRETFEALKVATDKNKA